MTDSFASFDYEALIQTCDAWIRSGRVAEVVRGLEAMAVPLSQTPRRHRVSLARICRRVGLVQKGLRFLQPVIRHEQIHLDPPTAAELSEYAVLLSRFGSIQEALDLLKTVNGEHCPDALLFEAFCHISRWDYVRAVPLLERYLKLEVDDYAKTVARVNLASSQLVTGDLSAAETTLEEVLERARETHAIRLLANAFETRAQVHLQREDFEKARADLESARNALTGSGTYDDFFVSKWTAALRARECKSIAPLVDFRMQALARGAWESVRECDFFALKIEFDQERFDHLLFGTSMPAYRARIHAQLPFAPSDSFIWGSAGANVISFEERGLRPGQKMHQLFSLLLSDFYVPQNLGVIYAALYPGELLDLDQAIARVRQILKRARRWLLEKDIPLALQQERGGYRLTPLKEVGVRLNYFREQADTYALRLTKLRSTFPHRQAFTAHEACQTLALSRSSFARWLDVARERAAIEIYGDGRGVHYRVA